MSEEIINIAKKRYSKEKFNYHIVPVVKNALLLSKRLNADKEVVEISAYLHDIGKISKKHSKKDNNHHIVGAEESRIILKRLGYDNKFIDKVYHCILAHRGSKGPNPKTKEAKIVNCADAMAHFDTFLYLFKHFLKKRSFEETIIKVEKRVKIDWNKKISLPEAREIVKDKYEAIMLLIKSMKDYE
jgi:putative nucleotidyltransferase with HDIG domain